MKSVRVRLAPSPTGYIHIGTLRTAFFNYFLARQSGGEFILRIEDTDRTRLVDDSLKRLLQTFKRLNLDYDEGPILDEEEKIKEKGEFGPYIQSERLDIYQKHIQKLLEQKDAYYCFCSKERLDRMREQQKTLKQTPKYDRHCLKLSEEEIKSHLEAEDSYVIRMKVPEGETIVEDLIRGSVKFQNEDIDDQVLIKSDGFPTYHFAVVVDDSLMNITHIIRGQEWIPSTPKHVILYAMLGLEAPAFAHVPLLLNSDKTKLSKRQGDVAAEDYLDKGYLPDTLMNFLGTLGFNPKDDQEIYSREELIKYFDIKKVNKAGAVVNNEKLRWMNQQYIKEMSNQDFLDYAREFVETELVDQVKRAALVEKNRLEIFSELEEKINEYKNSSLYNPEILVWKKSDKEDAKLQLSNILSFLNDLSEEDFASIDILEGQVRGYIEKNELSNGNVLWPLRVALSGKERSASPFELLWVFGKDEGKERIKKAIDELK